MGTCTVLDCTVTSEGWQVPKLILKPPAIQVMDIHFSSTRNCAVKFPGFTLVHLRHLCPRPDKPKKNPKKKPTSSGIVFDSNGTAHPTSFFLDSGKELQMSYCEEGKSLLENLR